MTKTKCAAPECMKASYCRGYCRQHYERLLAHGDVGVHKNWKGGISSHPLYGSWCGMIGRCHNPRHSSYGRYGNIGISVCERWRDFRNFLADMGERPPGRTLDRIDPKGPYVPSNCRWATVKEQRANWTPEGAARVARRVSEAKTAYWRAWRTARGRDSA